MSKQVWVTNVTETRATDVENGDTNIRWKDGKAYRWVKNSTGGALSAGEVVYWGAPSANLDYTQVYTPDQSSKNAALSMMAGVVIPTSIASAEYGWIQSYGPCDTVSIFASETTTMTIGTTLIGVTAKTYLAFGAAANTAPKAPFYCMAMEAVATATVTVGSNKKAFVKCI